MTLIECEDRESWIEIFVGEFRAASRRAKAAGRKAARLCLAGGSTPEPIYRAIAALPGPGLPVELWLGDERAVRPGDRSRNGAMVARAFAGSSWAPALKLWPSSAFDASSVSGDADSEGAARRDAAAYAIRLSEAMGGQVAFDLSILGLGVDGHTASLFPGDPILKEASALTGISRSPVPPSLRMTLTYPALAGSRRTLFAVAGPEKEAIVKALASEDPALPASTAGGADRAIVYLRA